MKATETLPPHLAAVALPAPSHRVVYHQRAKCPKCRSTALLTQRSEEITAGIMHRATKCRTCQWNFTVVVQ